MSAKADDLINQMFLRAAAQVLGIRLSGSDLEKASTIVKADIVRYSDADQKRAENKRTKSSFCVIQ